MPRSFSLTDATFVRFSILLAALGFAIEVFGQSPLSQIVSDDPAARQSALKKLASLTPEQKLAIMPEFTRMIGEENGYRVAPAFAQLGPLAVPYLNRLIESPDAFVRVVAVRSLGMMRPASPESIDLFRKLLLDGDGYVRRDAAASLLSIGVEDDRARSIANVVWQDQSKGRPISGGIPEWIQALSSQDDFVRYDAQMLLKNAGAAAVPPLLDALKAGNDRLRMGALAALEFMHSYRPDVEAACIHALRDPSPRLRDMAREVLKFQISEAAHDALLEDEIAEGLRQQAAKKRETNWLATTHSRGELLSALPPNSDHDYVLGVANPTEATAPDGTAMLVVIHRSTEKGEAQQVLRVWNRRGTRYSFVRDLITTGDETSNLSAGFFRFHGKLYLHLMTLFSGHAFLHEDELFRVERNTLTPILQSIGSPIKLNKDESIAKGVVQAFHDDDLHFEFGIYKRQDPNCCPSSRVKGTYTIVGNELRIATWKRSTD